MKTIYFLLGCFLCSSLVAVSAQEIGFVGQADGQIFNEFSNTWLDKPIRVLKDQTGNTELEIGNLFINDTGKSRYQARCRLNVPQQAKLVEFLGKALTLSDQYKTRQQEKTEKLGEFLNGSGADATGLKVYFFCRKQVMNPVGAILFIRDYEDNYHMKLYLYPSQIRQLISLLGVEGFKKL